MEPYSGRCNLLVSILGAGLGLRGINQSLDLLRDLIQLGVQIAFRNAVEVLVPAALAELIVNIQSLHDAADIADHAGQLIHVRLQNLKLPLPDFILRHVSHDSYPFLYQCLS